MTPKERAVMQQALKSLEKIAYDTANPDTEKAITALREALAEQEPVAWRDSNGWFTSDKQLVNTKYDKWTAVYAAPVRTKDLTDDEILKIAVDTVPLTTHFARAVIAKDREKNRG